MSALEKSEQLNFKGVEPIGFVKYYDVEDHVLGVDFKEPEADGFWPFIYILTAENQSFILYP
jgi:hypothetical protein